MGTRLSYVAEENGRPFIQRGHVTGFHCVELDDTLGVTVFGDDYYGNMAGFGIGPVVLGPVTSIRVQWLRDWIMSETRDGPCTAEFLSIERPSPRQLLAEFAIFCPMTISIERTRQNGLPATVSAWPHSYRVKADCEVIFPK